MHINSLIKTKNFKTINILIHQTNKNEPNIFHWLVNITNNEDEQSTYIYLFIHFTPQPAKTFVVLIGF